ncbi:MAG: preprotein translocase subunit SecE [Lawsonibacter sp.]|nr:preprotein translocase subunit SecE [Lawsonibacter sp.]
MAENEKLEQTAKAGSDKADKAKKDKKTGKPSIFSRAKKWLKEMRSELKKVQWPTRKQTVNNTVIVIACVIVVGFFIWIFDFIAGSAIDVLLTLLR